MANSKKKDEVIIEDTETVNEVTEDRKPSKVVAKKPVKLDDQLLVNVKSNTFGTLFYRNPRTGDAIEWSHFGDVQQLTMGDLRAMKGTQRAFYENQWIYIMNIEDAGYEDVTADDICKALMVTQYYKNILDPDNFSQVFSWPEEKIRERVSMMSPGAKMNLVVAANTAITNGALDSLKKIKTLEDVLGCELDRPE